MNIFKIITGNIIKWWQCIILPIFHLDNNNSKNNPQANEATQTTATNSSESQESSTSESSNENADSNDPMAILNRINQEKEDIRRKEIELAKREAEEKARIASIMNANKVDVNSFIQAGKEAYEKDHQTEAASNDTASENFTSDVSDDEAKKQEDLRRAQEILDRLNREAAEDEAKKIAEIDAAKREAEEKFGQ